MVGNLYVYYTLARRTDGSVPFGTCQTERGCMRMIPFILLRACVCVCVFSTLYVLFFVWLLGSTRTRMSEID